MADTPVDSGTSSPTLFTLARVVVGVGIVLTVILGSVNGIALARMTVRYDDLRLGQVTVRANQYPDPILALLASQSARSIRRWISIARDDPSASSAPVTQQNI